jgi:putative hydrolase of the HAD superfamily
VAASLLTGTRAVFFDAVGTVLFPSPPATAVYARLARRYGAVIPEEVIRERFRTAFRGEEVIDQEACWVTSEDREVARWRRIVANTLTEIPDTTALFPKLFQHFSKPEAWVVGRDVGRVMTVLSGRGMTLGMGSNYDSRLTTVVAGHPELAPLRDRVVISAAVGVRKPGAGFFREVRRVAGCEPGQILFVGDDVVNDYEGALAAGFRTILLDLGNRHEDVPHRISALAELTSHVE